MSKKLSELPVATSVEAADLLMITQGGNSKQVIGSTVVGGWETLETIEVASPQSILTFSGLNGDLDKVYRIIGRWINGTTTTTPMSLHCLLNAVFPVAADISMGNEKSYDTTLDTFADTSSGETTSGRIAQLKSLVGNEVAVTDILIPVSTAGGLPRVMSAKVSSRDDTGGNVFFRSSLYAVHSNVAANVTSIALRSLEILGDPQIVSGIGVGSSFSLQRLRV